MSRGNGGLSGLGTVFRLRTDGSGFQLLHTFAYGVANDGAEPYAPLTLDGSGRLFGTTENGGSADFGTLFALSRPVVTPGPFAPARKR